VKSTWKRKSIGEMDMGKVFTPCGGSLLYPGSWSSVTQRMLKDMTAWCHSWFSPGFFKHHPQLGMPAVQIWNPGNFEAACAHQPNIDLFFLRASLTLISLLGVMKTKLRHCGGFLSSRKKKGPLIGQRTNYLLFVINAFQSLEDELGRETILQLVSLKLQHSFLWTASKVQMELCLNPELIKKWTKIKRREAKEAKRSDQPTNPLVVKNLIEESVLNESLSGHVYDSCILYGERFMEFLIGMLSQLPAIR
jgi:hypothetical protein